MIQVSRELYRSPRPKDIYQIPNYIKTVINLESGAFELFNDDCYERQRDGAEDLPLFFKSIKCSDITPPNARQVAQFLRFVAGGGVTLVHCLSGVDRTGFMCAVYRMQIQGWSFKEAHREWVSLGRHPWYFWWTRELKKYIKERK